MRKCENHAYGRIYCNETHIDDGKINLSRSGAQGYIKSRCHLWQI